ncbi:MAG TPA: glycerophosphodiester phosphodiesterase, partial [Pyrinomonadaceae bacterium]|nr:glycerophosphodiester phosphodiesterase [Pyrinomonadaceae bacterium]
MKDCVMWLAELKEEKFSIRNPHSAFRNRKKWLFAPLLIALLLGTLYAFMKDSLPKPEVRPGGAPAAINAKAHHPLVMAHRGGAGLWPENTLHAFSRAAEMGVDVLEMDLHSTADGALVIIHDETVDRTTDGTGPVNRMTLDQLKRLDAAYRWSTDGGRSFPLRGQGIGVPTLGELFKAFPRTRFNIDIKQEQPSLSKPFCRVIRESGMADKVLVASFDAKVLDEFRRECAEVATSASAADVSKFLALKTIEPVDAQTPAASALQVPEYAGGRQVLTRE